MRKCAFFFFFSSRRRHTRLQGDWSSDVCSSDLLRELSFRAEGEGTGKSVDLDRYDDYYTHLFVWNKPQKEIVGAYRLARTVDILPEFGVDGLYTNTLFRFKDDFFDLLGPAIELGRSFVRPEYQRQYAPLLLLWKAIGRYVALNL